VSDKAITYETDRQIRIIKSVFYSGTTGYLL